MSFDLNIGGKALGARFAGLGMATVVAFAVAGAPGVAVAEGETGTAGSELQTVDQSVNTEVAGDDSSSVKEPSASEVANDSSTVIETQSDQDLQTPSASSGETSLPSGVTTSQEHTAGSAEVTERTKSDNAVVQAPSITGNTSAETQPQAEAQTEPVAEAPSNDVEKTSSESVGAGVSVKESGTQTAEKANTQLNTQLATKEPPKSSMQPAAQSNAKTRASSGTQTAAKPAAKTSENGKSAAAKELSAKATPAKAQASQKATPKQAQQLQASEGSDAIQDPENVYRVYNPWSGEHLYTSSLSEATHLFGIGWQWEDAAYQASASRGQQVFRLYNRYTGAHFYTGSQGEYDHLGSIGWSKEGKVWYAFGDTALFRLYNPYSAIGEHLYTTSADERATAMRAGWRDEGVAWGVTPGFRAIAGRWVVSSSYGTQERYWVSSDTRLARNRYVEPSEGTGYKVAAYATGSGAVVRNKTRVGNGVMLADNDGRLRSVKSGWMVTNALDGHLERYYIASIGKDSQGKDILGARTGWFSVDNANYYGFYNDGYVAHNMVIGKSNDEIYAADNDGRLSRTNDYRATGWRYANTVGSASGWFISTDTNNFKVMVFHKHSGNDPWALDKDYECGEGANTFMGHFTVRMKLYEKNNGTSYCRYNTIYAIDPSRDINTRYQMFHAFLRDVTDDHIIETGLGQKWSAGCIRLEDSNAKWIYDNVPVGADIYNY